MGEGPARSSQVGVHPARMLKSLFARREDGCSPPESQNGRVDPQQQLPQELGGYEKTHTAPVCSQKLKSTPRFPTRSSGPPIRPSQVMRRGTRPDVYIR
jgi:hypothetical protein